MSMCKSSLELDGFAGLLILMQIATGFALVEKVIENEVFSSHFFCNKFPQMQKVEGDLQKSKQAREKQAKEFARQFEEEKYRHQHEVMLQWDSSMLLYL